MDILYQDNRILVALKPPGILSTDEPGGMPELLRQQLGDPTACVRTVHRLDQPVAGVMVFARSRVAASLLGQQVQAHRLEKEYLAVCRGILAEKSGTLRDLLWRDRETSRTLVVTQPGRDVQEAVLDYRVLAERDGLSLVQIRLHTGRTHQIRVQFSSRGLPLMGDRRYGAEPEESTFPIALFSRYLALDHPQTGQRMEFAHRPPMDEPWQRFEKDVDYERICKL